MNERERILDLVKKGVLSTEEALDLLESIAQAKDASQIQRAADEVKAQKQEPIAYEQIHDEAQEVENTTEQIQQTAQETEELYAQLAERVTKASAEIDRLALTSQTVAEELASIEEALMHLNTKEELELLTVEDSEIRKNLEQKKQALLHELQTVQAQKEAVERALKDSRREQWNHTKEKISQKLEMPDDWKEQATETLNQVSDKMVRSGSKLGKALFKTIQSVTDTIGENVEWKNVQVKVPGMAATKFDKTFTFEPTTASIVDIKVANGKVTLKKAADDTVKVIAAVKLYGKLEDTDVEQAFAQRSELQVDAEKISIQIPNKRIRADLVIYLPEKMYDYVSIKLLNGSVVIEELIAKDVFVKSTNGNLQIESLNATMLELEGVNGDIEIMSGHIRDIVVESINGTITLATTPETASFSLVNGDIKATLTGETLKKYQATTVNGSIKVSLPATLGVTGIAKTNLGSIQSRMSDYEVIREKKEKMNQFLQFERALQPMATIELTTTTGSIYLKDNQVL